jgi:hypothetical protein
VKTLEEVASTWARGALVFIRQAGTEDDMIRPAAFVYSTPDGLAWVEPSYADPWGASSNALHFAAGVPMPVPGDGFRVITAAGDSFIVVPYGDDADLIGDSLEWFARHLAETGTDWATERERVRELIGS